MPPAPVCTLPDLLVLLPYHVGFHLAGSLVVVAFDGARVDLVERVDLRDGRLLPAPVTARLVEAVDRRAPSAVLVVAYAADGPTRPALDGLALAMTEVAGDVRVAEVRDGWWRDPDEAPWVPLPDPADVPLVVEYVGRGVAPLPDRPALATALAPVPDPRLDRAVAARGIPGVAAGLGAWRRVLAGEDDADDEITALAFLGDVACRDALLVSLVPLVGGEVAGPTPDRGRGDALAERVATRGALVRMARRAPESVRATALSVLAVWAWDSGDGATATTAADLALVADPDHSLAGLVRRLVEHDVRPPAA